MVFDMHVVNLGIDVTTFENKTVEEIEKAYSSTYEKMCEKASTAQLVRITKSFHAVMHRKTGCEMPLSYDTLESDSETS